MSWVQSLVDRLQVGRTVVCMSALSDYFADRGNELTCRWLWKCCLDRRFASALSCTAFVFRPDAFSAEFVNDYYVVRVRGWPDSGMWRFEVSADESEDDCCCC